MATEAKLERLMNLTAALVDAERPLTALDIQQRVAGYSSSKVAFRRTFERDKVELRELGVPIEVVPVPGTFPEEEGYVVDRVRYEQPDAGLDAEELAALRLALEAIGIGDPDDTVGGALRRLGGVVDGTDGVAPDAALVGDLGIDAAVVPLFAAIAERRVVTFDYLRDGDRTRRSLEPWTLGLRRGHWYVEGHDRDRGEPRQFRVDRIVGDPQSGEAGAFEPPSGLSAPSDRAPWRFGSGEAHTATIRVAPEKVPFVAASLGPRASQSADSDGWTSFDFEVTDVEAFRSFVIGLLDDVEVVGPPQLRRDLIEWLTTVAGGPR